MARQKPAYGEIYHLKDEDYPEALTKEKAKEKGYRNYKDLEREKEHTVTSSMQLFLELVRVKNKGIRWHIQERNQIETYVRTQKQLVISALESF